MSGTQRATSYDREGACIAARSSSKPRGTLVKGWDSRPPDHQEALAILRDVEEQRSWRAVILKSSCRASAAQVDGTEAALNRG
jgi:hypothetical protein